MAINPTTINTDSLDGATYNITWASLDNSDTDGVKVSLPGHTRKTVTISGAFDSATVVIQGSNDGTNWFTLSDTAGSAISATSGQLSFIKESPLYVRPSTSGGGASQDVTVIMMARKQNPLRQ